MTQTVKQKDAICDSDYDQERVIEGPLDVRDVFSDAATLCYRLQFLNVCRVILFIFI